MLQRFIKMFRPKDKIFYPLFTQMASNVEIMGREIERVFYEKDLDQRERIFSFLADLEHKTDSLAHKIFIELSKNFIIPFDREDIYKLTSTLDDVADNIHGCAKRMQRYQLHTMNEKEVQEFSHLVYEATKCVQCIIQELSHLKKTPALSEAIVKMNSIENQGDDIFNESLQRLFSDENDIKIMIKKKEIYQILEVTIDKCEDVANVVESIVLKYS